MATKKKPAKAPTAPTATTVAPVAPVEVAATAANPLTQAKSTGQALSPDKNTDATARVVGGLIDELGRLEAELAPYALKLARVDALRKAVRGAAPTHPGDKPLELRGEEYEAFLGPRAKETVIDRPALVKLIGAEKYAQFATTTQKALFANVSNPLHLALVLTTELTGPRPLRVIARAAKDPAAAKQAA